MRRILHYYKMNKRKIKTNMYMHIFLLIQRDEERRYLKGVGMGEGGGEVGVKRVAKCDRNYPKHWNEIVYF